MNCREYRRAVMGPARGGDLGLETHRQQCSTCASFAERAASATRLLGRPANTDARAPADFAARVAGSLPERESAMAWAALRLLPATTALALALLGWCWLTTPSPAELWAGAQDDQVLTWVLSGD